MRRATVYRLIILAAAIVVLEILCISHVISPFTMPAPHIIVRDLVVLLVSGKLNADIAKTLGNIAITFAISMVLGVVVALLIHGYKGLREALDPAFSTYYAVPVLAFYPLLVILFGLGDLPQIITGCMFALISVIVTMLDGLDRVPRVLRKVARIEQLSPVETALRVTVPFCIPYILTAAKLAMTYSIIGIVASEFLMARSGMGFEISFAYVNFDNKVMYPLILLILFIALGSNSLLFFYERRLLSRRGLKA
jgi:NitT/TauT family transport system permease protein